MFIKLGLVETKYNNIFFSLFGIGGKYKAAISKMLSEN
jgi:hypothetical protein